MISSLSFRFTCLGVLAALTTLVAGSACVQDQDFLIVERAIWFTDRDNCALTGSEDTPLAMAVDVQFDTRIGMAFLVTNNQSPNPNSNTGIDDSEILIEAAEVSLSFSGGALANSAFEIPLPTNSIPGGSSEPFLIQIPTDISQSLRSTMQGLPAGSVETLEMEVIFTGRKSNQVGNTKLGEIETRPYVYPFEICYGCLVNCGDAMSCETGEVTCPSATEWSGACGFAQGVSIYHPSCTP